MTTPTTPEPEPVRVSPVDALIAEWTLAPEDRTIYWNAQRDRLRAQWPGLAEALDRLVADAKLPPGQRRPFRNLPPWQRVELEDVE